jgi:hypothetical protein
MPFSEVRIYRSIIDGVLQGDSGHSSTELIKILKLHVMNTLLLKRGILPRAGTGKP